MPLSLTLSRPLSRPLSEPLTGLASGTSGATGASLLVEWTDASSDEDGFRIELSTDSFSTIAKTVYAAANAESVTVTGLLFNQEYDVRAYAYNEAGDSAAATTTPVTTVPDVPRNVTATPAVDSSNVAVTCVAPVGPNAGAEDYLWEYKLATEPTTWTTWAGGNTASETITGLTGETAYDFRVSGRTAAGDAGVASASVRVTTGEAYGFYYSTAFEGTGTEAGWTDSSGSVDWDSALAGCSGTKCILVPATESSYRDVDDETYYEVCFRLNVSSFAGFSSGLSLGGFRGAGGTGATCLVRADLSGHLGVYSDGNNSFTSAAMTAGNWYWVKMIWNEVGSVASIAFSASTSDTSPVFPTSGTQFVSRSSGSGVTGRFYLGYNHLESIYFDQLIINKSAIADGSQPA